MKRGLPNVCPSYWDIPGGSVEENELPREAALREAMEEVNQNLRINQIIHEDSQFDVSKDTVFTRLVYAGEILEVRDIIFDPEEHTDFVCFSSLEDMVGEFIVPYLLKYTMQKKSPFDKGIFLISFQMLLGIQGFSMLHQ